MDRTNYCAECEQHAREVARLTAELEEAQAAYDSLVCENNDLNERAQELEAELAYWSKRHRLGLMYHGDTVTEVFLVDDETGESVDLDLDSSMVVEVIELLKAELAEARRRFSETVELNLLRVCDKCRLRDAKEEQND